MSERYRIPKARLSVEIRCAGGAADKATLFLGEGRNGPESVLDCLNGAGRFLVAENDARELIFLRVEQIVSVTLEDAEAFAVHGGLEIAADLAKEVRLWLRFDDGSELDGVATYELQESSSRVQDFLNSEEGFFPFFHDGCASYVNKQRIARASPR